jgi:hypothetical protein
MNLVRLIHASKRSDKRIWHGTWVCVHWSPLYRGSWHSNFCSLAMRSFAECSRKSVKISKGGVLARKGEAHLIGISIVRTRGDWVLVVGWRWLGGGGGCFFFGGGVGLGLDKELLAEGMAEGEVLKSAVRN